jgi:hypothetical protein
MILYSRAALQATRLGSSRDSMNKFKAKEMLMKVKVFASQNS